MIGRNGKVEFDSISQDHKTSTEKGIGHIAGLKVLS
jgi:hypothetical protein